MGLLNMAQAVTWTEDRLLHGIMAALWVVAAVVFVLQGRRSARSP